VFVNPRWYLAAWDLMRDNCLYTLAVHIGLFDIELDEGDPRELVNYSARVSAPALVVLPLAIYK
jgi:hypothetical protein